MEPIPEIAEITDRLYKMVGLMSPFEKPNGHRTPMLMHAFGSETRKSLTCGIDYIQSHPIARETNRT